MAKKLKIEDEPGAEDRFERGIRTALATPHHPHKQLEPEAKSIQVPRKKGAPGGGRPSR